MDSFKLTKPNLTPCLSRFLEMNKSQTFPHQLNTIHISDCKKSPGKCEKGNVETLSYPYHVFLHYSSHFPLSLSLHSPFSLSLSLSFHSKMAFFYKIEEVVWIPLRTISLSLVNRPVKPMWWLMSWVENLCICLHWWSKEMDLI